MFIFYGREKRKLSTRFQDENWTSQLLVNFDMVTTTERETQDEKEQTGQC